MLVHVLLLFRVHVRQRVVVAKKTKTKTRPTEVWARAIVQGHLCLVMRVAELAAVVCTCGYWTKPFSRAVRGGSTC